jgi:hypothetical protein
MHLPHKTCCWTCAVLQDLSCKEINNVIFNILVAVIMNITTSGVLHYGLLFYSLGFHKLLFVHSLFIEPDKRWQQGLL